MAIPRFNPDWDLQCSLTSSMTGHCRTALQWILLALTSGAGGCAGRHTSGSPRSAVAAVAPVPPWTVGRSAVTSLEGDSLRVVEQSSTRTLAFVDATRVALENGVVHFAPHELPDVVAAAIPVAAGWVFMGSQGGVYAASDFLRPVRSIGTNDHAYETNTDFGRGRVVVSTSSGWLVSDGSSPLAPFVPPAGTDVQDLLFQNATLGVLLASSAVLLTRDGGLHWSPLAIPAGDSVRTLSMRDNRIILAGTYGPDHWLRDDGTLEARPPAREPPTGPAPSPEPPREMVLALLHDPLALRSAGSILADGRIAVAAGRALYLFAPNGTLLSEHPLPGVCGIDAWGSSIAVTCVEGRQFRTTDGRVFEPLGTATPAQNVPSAGGVPWRGGLYSHFSDDGVHALAESACEQSDDYDTGVCVRLATGARRTIHLSGRPTSVSDGHGDAFALGTVGGSEEGQLLLLHAESGTHAPVSLRRDGSALSVLYNFRPMMLPTGELLVLTPDALGAAPVGSTIEMHAHAADLSDFCFADALHGFAGHDGPHWLQHTSDGGQHWTELPTSTSAQLPTYATGACHCVREGCVRGRLVLPADGPFDPLAQLAN